MADLIVIMGVSGSGKSTISKALGGRLVSRVMDADDYHPNANIEKMTQGVALTDDDRIAWLDALNFEITSHDTSPVILACSALTPYVQSRLEDEGKRRCIWVLLEGSAELIATRLNSRQDHFMSAALLESQFEALKPPKEAIFISIDQSVDGILDDILNELARV